MSLENPVTLWQFLFGGENASDEARAVRAALDQLDEARERLAPKLPVPVRAGLKSSLDDGLKQILDVPLGNLLVSAWATSRSLAKYCDERQHPPEEIVLLPLKEHTIKSTHRPSIDVLINDSPLEVIDFEVQIALALQGAVLKIQAARIRELRTGSCTGKGTLKCGPTVLVDRKTRAISLPGVLTFPNGVPIRPRDWRQPGPDLQK